jgi:hypothetical protein
MIETLTYYMYHKLNKRYNMKKTVLYFIAVAMIGFTGCAGEQEAQGTSNEETVPTGWIALDLSEPGQHYGLPMLINVPDENLAKGIAEISEGPLGGTQISAGREFNIEILPGGGDIAQKKTEIEQNTIFKTTYVFNEPDALIYKYEIEDAGVVQYHIYVIKNFNGRVYEVESIKDEEDYSEAAAKRMLEAAKSLRAKPEA